jgi:hypothetical protein
MLPKRTTSDLLAFRRSGRNLVSQGNDLQRQIKDIQKRNIIARAGDELFKDLGRINSGQFAAIDPDTSVVRIILSAINLFDEFGVNAHFAGFNASGDPQFWINADDGVGTFAAGRAVLNANGMILDGLFYPIQMSATVGGYTRSGKFGMTLLAGDSVPSMQWSFSALPGDSLVLNGDAEAGALTNWTDSASAWSAYATDPYTGLYSFRHDPTVLTLPALLSQTITGINALTKYDIEFTSMRAFGYLTPHVYLVWKDAGHVALRTDVIEGNPGSSWQTTAQSIASPATAAEVVVELDNGGGDPFQDFRYDEIKLGTSGISMSLSPTDNGFRFDDLPIVLQEVDGPLSPTTGFGYIYQSKVDHKFHVVNSSGVDIPIGADLNSANFVVPLVSDFFDVYGGTGIDGFRSVVIGGGTVNNLPGEAGHPGIWRIGQNGANTGGYIQFGSYASPVLISGGERFEFVFRIGATASKVFKFGFGDGVTAVATYVDGVWIHIAGTTLDGRTSSNSTASNTGTNYTISTGVWYRCVIVVNSAASLVTYTLYDSAGAVLWTDTLSTNIPTATGRETGIVVIGYGTTAVVAANMLDADRIAVSNDNSLAR